MDLSAHVRAMWFNLPQRAGGAVKGGGWWIHGRKPQCAADASLSKKKKKTSGHAFEGGAHMAVYRYNGARDQGV